MTSLRAKTNVIVRFVAFGFLGLLCACSKTIQPAPSVEPVAFLALLPIEVPEGVRRERVELIESAVRTELQNKGYLFLPAQAVHSKCPESRCENIPALFDTYGIEAIGVVALNTVNTNSFLIGSYDTIAGNIRFINRAGRELLRGEYSSQTTGGLLINSGSIQQIAKTFTDTFRDDTFAPLARDFARGLASTLPPPPSTKQSAAPEIISSAVSTVGSSLRTGVRELCVMATPHSILRVKFENHAADLRETDPGRYCTRYSLAGIAESRAVLVEARSFSGLLTTKMFELNGGDFDCELEKVLSLQVAGNRAELQLQCKHQSIECTEMLGRCGNLPKVVYRSETSSGPFEKVGEFKGTRWSDSSRGHVPSTYSVALRIAGGIAPRPVTLSASESSTGRTQ